jgi:sulfatase maturation enzyme AslB (radical SAM superfamily)
MSQIKPNLSSLYISPLEQCNLNCKVCYTRKTKQQLSKKDVLNFVDRYRRHQPLNMVTFCGGEVFLLDWFCEVINLLTESRLIVEIITNGTINKLQQITQPNSVNLIISLDGLAADHDLNRGGSNFALSWRFLLEAIDLGFHFEIFTVVTQHNFDHLDNFEQWLTDQLGFLPVITYHPRKPRHYLQLHPISNRVGAVEQFNFLNQKQLQWLYRHKRVFPPVKLGCHQLSLMSDGQVYGCCEGYNPLGMMDDSIEQLIANYQQCLITSADRADCLNCLEPDFVCGLKEIISDELK